MKISFFLLFFLPCIASAEIVKCVDHGQVTYRNNSCANDVPDQYKQDAQPNIREPVAHRTPISQPTLVQKEIVNIVAAPNSLSIPLKNGSYNVLGSVSGVPTIFQIDTGASKTAVSREIADAAGISDYACVNRMEAATANGVISVCAVKIKEITFGNFSVRDIEVIIMPNMQPQALLGMDVLQHYVIEQRAKALKISN